MKPVFVLDPGIRELETTKIALEQAGYLVIVAPPSAVLTLVPPPV